MSNNEVNEETKTNFKDVIIVIAAIIFFIGVIMFALNSMKSEDEEKSELADTQDYSIVLENNCSVDCNNTANGSLAKYMYIGVHHDKKAETLLANVSYPSNSNVITLVDTDGNPKKYNNGYKNSFALCEDLENGWIVYDEDTSVEYIVTYNNGSFSKNINMCVREDLNGKPVLHDEDEK